MSELTKLPSISLEEFNLILLMGKCYDNLDILPDKQSENLFTKEDLEKLITKEFP